MVYDEDEDVLRAFREMGWRVTGQPSPAEASMLREWAQQEGCTCATLHIYIAESLDEIGNQRELDNVRRVDPEADRVWRVIALHQEGCPGRKWEAPDPDDA